MWLLLTAAYGLMNYNCKWQVLSDKILLYIEFLPVAVLPQLFVLYQGGKRVAIIARIVEDLLLAGRPATTEPLIANIIARIEFETIAYGPGHLSNFGLNLHQT